MSWRWKTRFCQSIVNTWQLLHHPVSLFSVPIVPGLLWVPSATSLGRNYCQPKKLWIVSLPQQMVSKNSHKYLRIFSIVLALALFLAVITLLNNCVFLNRTLFNKLYRKAWHWRFSRSFSWSWKPFTNGVILLSSTLVTPHFWRRQINNWSCHRHQFYLVDCANWNCTSEFFRTTAFGAATCACFVRSTETLASFRDISLHRLHS